MFSNLLSLYSPHLLIRGAPFYAILPFLQPYFHWEPLFSLPVWVHLNPFCHPPIQLSFLWHYISNFIWQQLRISILSLHGFPPDLSSLSFLLKTLRGINSSPWGSKRCRLPITVSIIHQIYLVLQPFQSVPTRILLYCEALLPLTSSVCYVSRQFTWPVIPLSIPQRHFVSHGGWFYFFDLLRRGIFSSLCIHQD